jgi:predicted nucleic acid-binding protein
MTYLIDTDWIVDVLHSHYVASQTLIELSPHGLAVSLISYGELYEGAYYAHDPHAAIGGLTAFLTSKQLLPLTKPIMERFGIARGQLPVIFASRSVIWTC